MIARATQANGPLERAAGSATTTKHEKNDSVIRDEEKAFSTWRARFALVGHTLYRTVNADGSILYLAGRWGYFRELKSLEAVAAFLAQIGGRV